MIDVSNIPFPSVLETKSFETIVAENIAQLTLLKPDYAWLESDDYMLLIEANSYRELHLRQEFNNRLRSSLLLFSKGSDLDAKALDYGMVRLADEQDDAFLTRTLESFGRYSTAGSAGSYEYHAKTVGAFIQSAKSVSLDVGNVTVYVANYDRPLTATELASVKAKLDEPNIHPLCFEHTVQEAAASIISLTMDIELLDINDQATIEPLLQAAFSRKFAIHDSLGAFEMLNNCNIAGVSNAVPTSHPAGVVPSNGQRLVFEPVLFTFKAALTGG